MLAVHPSEVVLYVTRKEDKCEEGTIIELFRFGGRRGGPKKKKKGGWVSFVRTNQRDYLAICVINKENESPDQRSPLSLY